MAGLRMDGRAPAQVYALLVGGGLLVLGILGFFYSADFGSPGRVSDVLRLVSVNGWLDSLYVVSGAAGLLAFGYGGRAFAGAAGALYLILAVWGFAIGDRGTILGFVPVNTAGDVLHALVGLSGLAAYAAARRQ